MSNYISKVFHLVKQGYGINDFFNRKEFLKKRDGYIKSQKCCECGLDRYGHVTLFLGGNTGDNVLSECVRKVVQNYFPVKGWDIIPVRERVDKNRVDEINKCSKLWIGGGGLFLPDSNSNEISGWQWPVNNETLDMILTGILFSRGANYFSDLVSRLTGKKFESSNFTFDDLFVDEVVPQTEKDDEIEDLEYIYESEAYEVDDEETGRG